MKFSKIYIYIFLISFSLTALLVWSLLPSNESDKNLYFTEGYDFHKLRVNNSDIDILKVGDKLNTKNIKDTKGELVSSISEKLLLLVVFDPNCPACNFSKDMMEDIRATTKNIKISYYPILVSSSGSDSDVQRHTQNLGFENYFYWSSESKPPDLLAQMITPSHILIDKNGTVIQVWYGSNKNDEVRKRMSDQISADLILINDVFETVAVNQVQN